jgi:hypothetical protein
LISSSVSGIATISSTVGTIQTILSDVVAKVTSLQGNVATIKIRREKEKCNLARNYSPP